MGFPACLIRRHNHIRALAVLGLPLEKPTFPAILPCPHCQQNALHIFDDILTDGLWLHCTACKVRGDIITFGADLWNISLPDTLAKFSDSGIITENDVNRVVGDYARCATRYAAAEQFWADAESQVWNHGDDLVACRLRDLGVKSEINGCYGLIGVAHHEQVTRFCSEMGRAKPTKLRPDGAYLVFPFYDLPGRLTGFLLRQFGNDNEVEQVFLSLSVYKRQSEAGYYLLNTLTGPAPEIFKGVQFISDDITWVLESQCAHLGRHGKTLPLAACYSGPGGESYGTTWAAFNFSRRIFHSRTISPELISRACNAKGYAAVVSAPTRVTKPYGLHIDSTISAQLRAMRKHAQTWQQMLGNFVGGTGELNAQAFMQRMTVPHDKLAHFIDNNADKFPKDFKERVMASVKMALAAPTRTQKRRIVLERDTGWWNQMGQQIANVRVVISKVLQADTGDKVYTGSIFMDNNVYEFSDSAKRIERMGLLAYAATVMAPHGKLVIFDRAWNRSSHMIAIQLRPPQLINVSTKYGWDENTNTFRLAKYEINHAGDVHQAQAWAARKTTKSFPEPTPIAPLPIHALISPAHENSFVWAFTAAVLGNLIAPILRKDCVATGVSTENFELAQRVGQALGCAVEQTTDFRRQGASRFLEQITDAANWPVIAHSVFGDDVLNMRAPRYFNRPLIMPISRQTRAVLPSYGWQTIKTAPTAPEYDLDPLRYILPAYVQRVLKMRLHMFSADDQIHKLVLTDLHRWFEETYGETFNLTHANALMAYPETAHTELLQEINNAVLSEKIAILPVARTKRQARNYVVRKKDVWWLNRHAVDRYFYSTRSVMPNWLAVIDLLRQDGVYAGEDVVHNMCGILVKTTWCDQFFGSDELPAEKETG
jgi:hypothetical protein